MLYSVYRQTVRTVSCYAVSADRLYVLCHVIQCLQTDCTYCVMLYSVCRQTVCTVSCYVIQCLQTDCTYCVMLCSVCRQTVCTVSCYAVSADRLYVLCHVMQCLQTDCTYCVMLYNVCRQTVPLHIYIHPSIKQLLHFICRITFILCLVLHDFA